MASMYPPAKGFDNGIKPTRLWHLTGRKHFQYISRCKRLRFQASNIQSLWFRGIVLSAAFGMAYAYGRLDPEKYRKWLFEPIPYCPPPPPPPKPLPCPRPVPEVEPCPCEIPPGETCPPCPKEKKAKKEDKPKDEEDKVYCVDRPARWREQEDAIKAQTEKRRAIKLAATSKTFKD